MNKSVKINYIYNLIYQIAAIIIPVITIPYISRVLGPENIGIYSFTLSISAYFILFGSLGISLYGKREIAYVQDNKEAYSKIFWELFLLKAIFMLISIIIFYFTFVTGNNDYNTFYKILILEIIADVVDVSWLFQGLEDFKKTVLRNLFVKILSLICIFIFVKDEDDLIIYYLIYVLSILLGNLSLWLYLPKFLVKVNIKNINIFRHLKESIIFFIPQVAIQIYTVLDRTMIGYLILDKSEVGFYTQGEKVIKLLLTIITAMGIVMLPRIASKHSEGDTKTIKIYLNKSFNLVYFLAFPMIFGIISVTNAFVPIFFGSGFDKVIPVMNIISPILLLIGMSNVIGVQYLLPTKHQKEYTLSVVIGAVVNFISNYFLIPKYGACGAAAGTVIAETVVTLSQIIFVRKQLDIKTIILSSWQYFLASVIMFPIIYVVGCRIDSNMLSIFIQVILGGIIYVGVLLLLKNKFILEYINLLKKIIFKKMR